MKVERLDSINLSRRNSSANVSPKLKSEQVGKVRVKKDGKFKLNLETKLPDISNNI